MGLRWRTYKKGDVFRINVREGDTWGGDVEEYDGPAWSLVEGETVLASFGICKIEEGIGHLWAYISEDAKGHGRTMIKFGRKVIGMAMSNYHRLQSNVRADKEEYVRFSEMLGLEKEGLLRKATADKRDLWVFSKVK